MSQCSRRVVAEQIEDESQVFGGWPRCPTVVARVCLLSFWRVRSARTGTCAYRGGLQPSSREQQQLARCVVQQIGAAHDLSDLLCRVVDHDRELIGNDAVASRDDEVANVRVEALRKTSLNQVDQLERLVGNASGAPTMVRVGMVRRSRQVPG